MAQYHGSIKTNLGIGAVFELITDKGTDNVSEIFRNLLMQDNFEDRVQEFDAAVLDFRKRLLKDAVIARDLRPWNLCAQKQSDGAIKLKMIDGMGHRYLIPIYDYLPFIARKRILKQLDKSGFMDAAALKKKYSNDTSNKWVGVAS